MHDVCILQPFTQTFSASLGEEQIENFTKKWPKIFHADGQMSLSAAS
jgi:hypothetical protein